MADNKKVMKISTPQHRTPQTQPAPTHGPGSRGRPHCPLCAASGAGRYAEEHGYLLFRCAACQTVFVDPQPTPECLRRLYEERAHQRKKSDYYGSYLSRGRGLREHARHLLGMLGPPDGERRLLEIGCGAGFFLDEARRAGWRVEGVELNRFFSRFARVELGLEVAGVPFEEMVSPARQFDVICLFDLISHLRATQKALERAFQLLRPGGRLFLQGGLKAENPHKPADEDWETPFHLFHYTRSSFQGLLERSGFHIELELRVAKIDVPRVLGSPYLSKLREALRPFFPVVRRALRFLKRHRVTDQTIYIIARRPE